MRAYIYCRSIRALLKQNISGVELFQRADVLTLVRSNSPSGGAMKVLSLKFLSLLLIATTIALSSPASLPVWAENKLSVPVSSNEKIAHALSRLTFGARPGDIEKVRSLGLEKFIDAQLNPASIPESPIVLAQVQKSSDILEVPSSKLLAEFAAMKKARKLAKNSEQVNPANKISEANGGQVMAGDQAASSGSLANRPARAANRKGKNGGGAKSGAAGLKNLIETGVIETKLVRAVESPRQLNEVLADFWFNHFNIAISKGVDRVLVGAYEEQAIRPNLLGNFRELVGATMHHPAMMFYLDNAQNTKAGFQAPNPKSKKNGINENYARELLELHTLGVDGGYSQADVMELARVLTGWGMPAAGNRRNAGATGSNGYWASFDQRRHDFGEKTILGQTIKGTGANEIEQVLDMLARHPSTAKHISFKLAQYFVDDNPPESLVEKLTQSYQQSNGKIKIVMSTLFASPEFWDSKYQNSKFKSPFHYAVSACRATGAHAAQPKQLATFLKLQGQPLYGCPTPDGYKNTKEAWLNPDGLMRRIDFASRLADYKQRSGPVDYRAVLDTVNGGAVSPRTLTAIENAAANQKVAAIIGSPEFMSY